MFTQMNLFRIDCCAGSDYAAPMSDRAFSAKCPGANCPPSDARPTSGTAYRRVKRNPPSQRDLQSHRERDQVNPGKDPCDQCALSVYLDKKDIEHHCSLFPTLGDYIFAASLIDTHGVMKHKPSSECPSHHNVWLYADVDRHALFVFAFHKAVV